MKKVIFTTVFILGMMQLSSQEIKNKNTTICWDTSSSMSERDKAKDFSVLEKVFQRNGNQNVQLLLFNSSTQEKEYLIKDGNWSQLKEDLQNVNYDGGTIYASLEDKIKNPNVYVFTDGNKNLSKDRWPLGANSFLINSSPNRDANFLERTALLTKSRLMDFAAMLPENVKKLQQKTAVVATPQKAMVMGTVYIDNSPAANVKVSLKGLAENFLTNPLGEFSVPASVGDTLVVTSRKSKTIKTITVDAMTHIPIFMSSNTVALDEVIVTEEKLKKAELTLTGYGLQNKESVGYAVSEVDAENISEMSTTVGDAINTKVPGLQVPGQNAWDRGAGGLGAAKIRGSGSINMNTNALVVVNGVPMQRSETSSVSGGAYITKNANMDYIDPANIATITVLKGLAATNAYGGEGRGGVILITTKTGVHMGASTEKPIDQALLKNNVYDESQGELTTSLNTTLSALQASESIDDAYDTYMALKNFNQRNMKFFLEAFDYFKAKDAKIAGRIISNILEWNRNDLKVLRAISKAFTVIEAFDNVVLINEEIIKIAPTDVNAYFNKATAKIELGEYQMALKELLALEGGKTYFSVDASGISKTLKREIKNLISQHKDKLNLANVAAEYLGNVKYKVRLVFEWNIPGAEFELQFVNPQKRFFNWEHTNVALSGRIENELKNNYRMEEYEFYGDVAGEWVINAKYLDDQVGTEKMPLALMVTIYTDFGYPTQTKEHVLVYFSQRNEKKNLKKLLVK